MNSSPSKVSPNDHLYVTLDAIWQPHLPSMSCFGKQIANFHFIVFVFICMTLNKDNFWQNFAQKNRMSVFDVLCPLRLDKKCHTLDYD